MVEWHEEDHPRDDDGKFTFKNGGVSSGGILEGRVEKTDRVGNGSGTDDGGADNGGGIGDKIGKVGSAIGNALMAVLNSQAIPALLNLLAAKYSADELNKLKEILYSQAARNEAAGNIDPRVLAGREEKEKMQNRADVLYGNDEEYNKKYHPEKLLPQDEEENEDKNISEDNALKNKINQKSEDLRENISNLKNKAIQQSAEIALGGLYNYGGYQYAKKHYGEDTVGMIDLAHKEPKNLNYAEHSIELNSYENIDNDGDREYFKKKITEQYKDYGYNPKTIKGRIFESNSGPSQRIAQDKDFLQTIKNNKDKILNHDEVSGYFPKYIDNKQSNLHFAIGHYDLRNGFLDNNGDLHIQMFDTYDFNKNNLTPLNQAGRSQMIKGHLIPYFSIHDIIVPKDVLDDIW